MHLSVRESRSRNNFDVYELIREKSAINIGENGFETHCPGLLAKSFTERVCRPVPEAVLSEPLQQIGSRKLSGVQDFAKAAGSPSSARQKI